MKMPLKIDWDYFWSIFHALLIAFLEGTLGGLVIVWGLGEITDKQINVMTDWNAYQTFQIWFWSGAVAGCIGIRNRLRESPIKWDNLILLVTKAKKVEVTKTDGTKEKVNVADSSTVEVKAITPPSDPSI